MFLFLTLNRLSASREAKRGINCRIYLNASKSLYEKQSKWDNKIFFWYFYWNYVCFFASFICLLKILNQKATVSKGTIGFDVWMATILSHIKPSSTKKNYYNRLSNSTTLFVVYKWPLKIETVVIKLNEIKVFEVLLSKFCGLLREGKDKSRLRAVKVFLGHIRNSFSSPTTVPCFAF